MDIQFCKISTTKDKPSSRSGLAALAELMRKLGLDAHFERLMHEGSRHLSRVAQLREELLMELLGIRRLPHDDALERWRHLARRDACFMP